MWYLLYIIKLKIEVRDNKSPENYLTAINDNNAERVKELIADGIDFNTKSIPLSMLSYAATRNNVDIAELLLNAGANPNSRNNDDRKSTAVFYASSVEMLQLLEKYGAEFDMDEAVSYSISRMKRSEERIDHFREGLPSQSSSILLKRFIDNWVDHRDALYELVRHGADLRDYDKYFNNKEDKKSILQLMSGWKVVVQLKESLGWLRKSIIHLLLLVKHSLIK